ncbi:alpha-(1,3)-fucosyltransferase C-like [Amblyomma americanum]
MNAKFNWTMSHRGDADVTVPYRMWAPPSMGFSYEDLNQTINKKSSAAVWLVSECEAKRIVEANVPRVDDIKNDFEYASFVARLTDANIISGCGGVECKNRHECLERFQNEYFFLLVVESSPCFEHPHQIMFDALQYSIIPIYFGSSSLGSTVPPFSVFDTTAAASVLDVVEREKLSDQLALERQAEDFPGI